MPQPRLGGISRPATWVHAYRHAMTCSLNAQARDPSNPAPNGHQEAPDNGVSTSRIAVDGMGEMQPLVLPERTASDRAMNRRVEILIKL